MERVLQYTLNPNEMRDQEIRLPEGSRVLRVGTESSATGKHLRVWVLGDRDRPTSPRSFRVVETGAAVASEGALLAPGDTRSGWIYRGSAEFATEPYERAGKTSVFSLSLHVFEWQGRVEE